VKVLLLAAACAAAVVVSAATASADSFPSRPITMVVPFAAGGPNDTVARILVEGMHAALGQPVVIENVTGANGTIGTGRVARAAADGYTIGVGSFNSHVVNGAVYTLPYDLLRDFEPVAMLSTSTSIVVAKKSLPVGNLHELIAWLKANPDRALVGTPGAGSSVQVYCAFFTKLTDTRVRLVPYRGAAPAMQDLVAGQLDFGIESPSTVLPQVKAGTIKAFAVTAKHRLPAAPEIPTVDEAGLPGFYTASWYGTWVPKGTPKEIVGKLNAAIVGALADPAAPARFASFGQTIVPREQQTPQALAAWHKAEIEKWWPIIKAAGIRIN
jgi:tripartite-type tricarboxylate transporter receptor subunit TctC